LKKAELVFIGRVLRSQGNRGQLKLRLREKGQPGIRCSTVTLRRPGGFETYEVESFEFDRNSTFLKLKGVDTLAGADALVGSDVYVPEACFAPPGKDRYYHFQVVGCRVITGDGAEVGTVEGVIEAGASLVLVVKTAKGECYVPFAEPICVRVDPERGEIVIEPPEGLLDLNEI
jgi:16S rRNA processing protein RimM